MRGGDGIPQPAAGADFFRILTAANMFTPERRPIDSRGSGKSAVGNGLLSVQAFSWCQNVPKRPSRRPNTRSVEMACLQEWDADRRQAAHAEKSLAVRELVRLSLRVQSTGVVAELHLDTALVAPSGSGADHERRIRRGCQATDGRADNWRGVLNNATDEHAQLLRDALCDPDFCMRFAIRRRIGSGGTVRLQWLFRTNSVVGRTSTYQRRPTRRRTGWSAT